MRKHIVSHPTATQERSGVSPRVGSGRRKHRFGIRLYASFISALSATRRNLTRSLRIAAGPFCGTLVATVAVLGVASVQVQQPKEIRIVSTLCIGCALAALLVGSFLCIRSTLAALAGRADEMSMRRTVGARSRDIGSQVMIEILLLGCLGSVLGLLPGLLVSFGMAMLLQLTPIVRPDLLLAVFCVSVGVVGVGGLYPTLITAHGEPDGRKS